MIRMHRRISRTVTALSLFALVLTGCTSEANNIGNAMEKGEKTNVVDTGFTLSTVGSFDSADTAVVLSTDLNNKAVSLINMETGKQYTLYYDGTTYVQDKYDSPMTISQIEAGDVVDVTFLKGKKKLASIKLSPDAWVYDSVDNYDLVGANRTASIGSQTYSLPDGVVVLSEGHRVETGEVVSQDVVTISGIDHEIYSVSVDRGHGYLRLKNDQPLLGGWIEVGNRVIRQIKEDMLLVVPEGSYQVVLSNKNVGCVKDVTIERDKEVVLDVSDLEVAEDATGKILFSVTPETAKVSVDGKPVDISKVVELPYGIHQVQAQASGYDTLTRHIQVGSEYATISFKLEETRKTDDNRNSVSDNSTSRMPWKDTLDTVEPKSSVSDNTLSSISANALNPSSSNKVYIDSPKGVEVYLDGNYVGLSPVRFTKDPGRHEITLKKTGYKTKTYTIYLDNSKKDETFSFSALEKESSSDKDEDKDNTTTSKSTEEAPLPTGEVSFSVKPEDAEIIKATIGNETLSLDKPMILKYGEYIVEITAKLGEKDYQYKGTISINDDFMKNLKEGAYEPFQLEPVESKPEEKPPVTVEEVAPVWMIIPGEAEDAIKEIIIDDISYEKSFPEKLTCGSHIITVKADGYEDCTKEFEIQEDKSSIEIELKPIPNPVNDQGGTQDGTGGGSTSDVAGDNMNSDEIVDGGTDVDDQNEEDNEVKTNTGDSTELTTETVTVNQQSHPIRNFFKSLFK